MIYEHKYAFYYWLNCVGFTSSEFKKTVEAICNAGLRVVTVDGWDEEDHSMCIKIIKCIPANPNHINYCKTENEKAGKQFITAFGKSLGGRFYFHTGRHQLKWRN